MVDLLELLSDNDARRVFEKIADKKRTVFGEISKEFHLTDEAAGQILDRLETGGLVQRVKSPLEDPILDTFFLSTKGMEAYRKIKALARI